MPLAPSSTGLFRSSWHPKKAVTVLWRRVETINPEAYTLLSEWVSAQKGGLAAWPSLAAMATNEVEIDPNSALPELTRLIGEGLPGPLREQVELLRDLIWEASDPNSDWLEWRPCRVCGRRWAVSNFQGFQLCPHHANVSALSDYLRSEMERYPGLVDHSGLIAALSTLPPLVRPRRAAPVITWSTNGHGHSEDAEPTESGGPIESDDLADMSELATIDEPVDIGELATSEEAVSTSELAIGDKPMNSSERMSFGEAADTNDPEIGAPEQRPLAPGGPGTTGLSH